MKPIATIASIVVLSASILLAEEPSARSESDGDGTQMRADSSAIVPSPSNNLRFEYKVVALDQGSPHDAVLNQLGLEGWELVTVVSHPDPRGGHTAKAYLKRTVPVRK